ncbi:MAG: hypothetical protein LAO09_02950 [Acidobacteriia bacterium]|nr:hypothetical protein [Terriglobia bacterium]
MMLRNLFCSPRALLTLIVAVTVGLVVPTQAQGQTYTVLHTFSGPDGARPAEGVTFDAAGNMYGVTSKGGTFNRGAVYELSPGGGGTWTETVLYSFGAKNRDGTTPTGGLVFDTAGNIYGTTQHGGAVNLGTVFQLSPGGGGTWVEKVLHNFGQGTDGALPMAGLSMDSAGNLFGTTNNGGTYQNCDVPATSCGTVFELSPNGGGGWTYSVIHNFQGQTNDGYFPKAAVTPDGLGNLYGTASYGGPYAGGIVFKLVPSGNQWKWKLVHPYGDPPGHLGAGQLPPPGGPEGYYPYAGMVFDPAGNMWSTTVTGGAHNGTIVTFVPNGNGGWIQYHPAGLGFNGYGLYPVGNLTPDAAGNIYGTTLKGGSAGNGTIFVVKPVPKGWKQTVLYNFAGGTDGGYSDATLVADQDGNLYGTTWYGGDTGHCTTNQPIPGCGVVFKLSLPTK